jgi:transcriptional regulator with XRE-family HTH domain
MPVEKVSALNGRKAAALSNTDTRTRDKASPPAPTTTGVNGDRVAPGLIGARLRTKRLAQGISLRQFARDLDVSASFISQLETGKAQPSVATLFAICAALGITTDELFENETTHGRADVNETPNGASDATNNHWRTESSFGSFAATLPHSPDEGVAVSSSPVVHPRDRKALVLDSGVTWESLSPTRSDKTDFMFVRYDVGGSSTNEGLLIRHVGTEYGFVLSGTLEVTLGFETYRLVAGDSISFDSTRPHRLANAGDVPVEAIWMNIEFVPNSQ